jgi:hypothetical protein
LYRHVALEEDVMIQLDEGWQQSRPAGVPLARLGDRQADDGAPETQRTDTERPAMVCKAGEADGSPPLFISPPPVPFPRIFPGL